MITNVDMWMAKAIILFQIWTPWHWKFQQRVLSSSSTIALSFDSIFAN
jgi:hypothetical protein